MEVHVFTWVLLRETLVQSFSGGCTMLCFGVWQLLGNEKLDEYAEWPELLCRAEESHACGEGEDIVDPPLI